MRPGYPRLLTNCFRLFASGRTAHWKAYMPWYCWMLFTTRYAKRVWSRKPFISPLVRIWKVRRTSSGYGWGATESSKYWLGVLNGLRNRGVQDILIISVDGLAGFSEAIAVAYPQTEVQRCIIHQIRSSTRYVSYKDVKAFTAALKPIYKAPTEESALEGLGELERTWSAKYPAAIRSWREHWDELSTMFKYPEQIRRIIYTTNAIENFNRQLRKVTKTKSAFVSDDALLKELYLVTMHVTDKWTMPIKDWGSILMHLMVYFGDRVSIRL